jgi:hypothetical protein
MWNSAEKPSISFSNSGLTASGVTSRPVKPVPPVVITTSTAGSLIQRFTCFRIALGSSSTMACSASSWPASSIMLISSGPDLSVLWVRVSDTVSTAIRTGMKGLLSSMRLMSQASP